MNPSPGFFETLTFVSVITALRYLFFCGIAWFLVYKLFRRRWAHRKIIPRFPTSPDVRREMKASAITIVIFGLVGAVTIEAGRRGWTQLYTRVEDHSMTWFFVSILLAILLHDTWFYWTHRLLHHPRLFRHTHSLHHRSTNPTPWAAFAFSPVEAVVQAAIFPLAVIVMPMHLYAFGLFMVWQMTFNVIGHTGFEFHPKWLMRTWLGRVLNTPTNHTMHHEKMRGNYGLYFNVWDRLMGTNHEDYERRFEEVMNRAPQR